MSEGDLLRLPDYLAANGARLSAQSI